MPVSVHITLPTAPTAGALVTVHELILVGNGNTQIAERKLVWAGVASLITMLEIDALLLFW